MSKICRVISSCLVAAGLVFLFYYNYMQNINSKFSAFKSPSYYTLQNYWYIFLAGIGVLVFSLLGCFFSWFKAIEDKEEILPNAGYVSKKDIAGWVRGTSLDTEQIGETVERQTEISEEKTWTKEQPGEEQTEILLEEERTEILPEEERTEILPEGEQTEMLPEEERTEILSEKDQEIREDER